MFCFLEVGIWIQEEHLCQLSFLEEIRQVPRANHEGCGPWISCLTLLHGIWAQAGDVVVLAGMLGPQSSDPVLHIVGHLHPDLHPHHQGVWEHGTQLDQQPPIATACTASFYNEFLDLARWNTMMENSFHMNYLYLRIQLSCLPCRGRVHTSQTEGKCVRQALQIFQATSSGLIG